MIPSADPKASGADSTEKFWTKTAPLETVIGSEPDRMPVVSVSEFTVTGVETTALPDCFQFDVEIPAGIEVMNSDAVSARSTPASTVTGATDALSQGTMPT